MKKILVVLVVCSIFFGGVATAAICVTTEDSFLNYLSQTPDSIFVGVVSEIRPVGKLETTKNSADSFSQRGVITVTATKPFKLSFAWILGSQPSISIHTDLKKFSHVKVGGEYLFFISPYLASEWLQKGDSEKDLPKPTDKVFGIRQCLPPMPIDPKSDYLPMYKLVSEFFMQQSAEERKVK